MNQFFIGQRVRVVRVVTPAYEHFVGREARVTEIREYLFPQFTGYGLDIFPITARADKPGRVWVWAAWQLEPILPSGHIASDRSYSELMEQFKEGVLA